MPSSPNVAFPLLLAAVRCVPVRLDQRGFGVQRAGIDGQRVVAGGNIVRQRQLQRVVICVRARQIRGQIARIFRAVFQRQLQRHVRFLSRGLA